MKELLTHLCRQLVDSPDKVSVSAVEEDGQNVLLVRVAEEDKGKIIGKQGKVIKAIRAVVAAAAAKADRKVTVEIE